MKRFFEVDAGHGNAGGIDKNKAKTRIRELLSQVGKDVALPGDQAGETEFNLPADNTLGQDPKNTLKGVITATRYGEEIVGMASIFRVEIDSLYLTAIELEKFQFLSSRELSLAKTAFQSARQFTGKILAERGVSNPYNETGKIVRPNQGTPMEFDFVPSDDAEVNKEAAIAILKEFRERTEEVVIEFAIFAHNVATVSYIETVAFMKVTDGVISGKMWLGELMAVIAKR